MLRCMLALLAAWIGELSSRRRHLLSGPSVLPAGLVVLALFQMVPLPVAAVARVPDDGLDPGEPRPGLPQAVIGDTGPLVASPRPS